MSREEVRRRREKSWKDSRWAKAAEVGLRAGSSAFGPAGELAYGAVGALTGFNTEKKYYDVEGSSILTSGYLNTGNGSLLTGIASGTAGDERTGISVKLTDFQIKLIVTFPQSVAVNDQLCRIIICYDREGNVEPGTPPSIADVLEDITDGLARVTSPLDVTNFGRFQILKDHMVIASSNGQTTTAPYTQIREGGIYHEWTFGEEKLKEHHLLWDSTPSENPTRGHLYLFAVSVNLTNSAGALALDLTTANQPFVSWYARSRFVDN